MEKQLIEIENKIRFTEQQRKDIHDIFELIFKEFNTIYKFDNAIESIIDGIEFDLNNITEEDAPIKTALDFYKNIINSESDLYTNMKNMVSHVFTISNIVMNSNSYTKLEDKSYEIIFPAITAKDMFLLLSFSPNEDTPLIGNDKGIIFKGVGSILENVMQIVEVIQQGNQTTSDKK